jgi:CBS domain containing-hemolysin-like protein
MTWLAVLVIVLVVLATVLAVAETAMSRTSRVRAIALREEGHRNAEVLERIQSDPPRYLNPIYLSVMFTQNGSAVLVAVLAERTFGRIGITVASLVFTLAYFVVVEAMAKTFGILHSDRAALALAPLVWLLGRALAQPTRLLIGVANVLLPGKGLKEGPFVSRHDIRSMAEVGHEQGSIHETERKLIHSVIEFGDTVVRQIMLPRPDIVAVEITQPLPAVLDTIAEHDFSRLPVYRGDLDSVEGVLYAKDVFKARHQSARTVAVADLMRPPHFIPQSKKVADLLREMQRDKFHMAIVVDEYGTTSGLVTLEDVLEELVGAIADEHDVDEPDDVEPLGDGRWRVDASVPIGDLNDLLGTDLPRDRWNTVGGLMFGVLGTIPTEGESVIHEGHRFTAEKVHGRRVDKVLVTREAVDAASGDG